MTYTNGVPDYLWEMFTPENKDYYMKSGATNLNEFDNRAFGVLWGGGAEGLNSFINNLRNPAPPVYTPFVAGPTTPEAQYTSRVADYNSQANTSNSITGGSIPQMSSTLPTTNVVPQNNQLGSVFNSTSNNQQQQSSPLSSMFNSDEEEDYMKNTGFNWGNYQGGRY